MIGQPAPGPIEGETLHGDPLEGWTPGKTTMLLFWSPFVGGAGEHLTRLEEVGRDHDHIEVASIGMGPKDRIEAVLAGIVCDTWELSVGAGRAPWRLPEGAGVNAVPSQLPLNVFKLNG